MTLTVELIAAVSKKIVYVGVEQELSWNQSVYGALNCLAVIHKVSGRLVKGPIQITRNVLPREGAKIRLFLEIRD